MGWVGMGCLFLVTFAANLPLGNTQQQYSSLGRGRIIVSVSTMPESHVGRRRVGGPGLQGDTP